MRSRGMIAALMLALVATAAVDPPDPVAAESPEVVSYALDHELDNVMLNIMDLEVSLEQLEHVAAPEVVVAVADGTGAIVLQQVDGLRSPPAALAFAGDVTIERSTSNILRRALEPPLHRRGILFER